MNNKINPLRYLVIGLICLLVLMNARPCIASAAGEKESLSGKLSIKYDSSTGTFSATYDGDQTLSSGATYTWYKDGSVITTSLSFSPNASGSYYCILKDTNTYDGSITSTSKILYRATGNNMTFDNSFGLYEVGNTVTVTATLNGNQAVTNWKTNAPGVAIPADGTTVSFKMPAQNVTVTATIGSSYSISVYGGTADKYDAYSGEVVTIRASSIDGKRFVSWSVTGGKVANTNSSTTTLTMGNSNVSVTANFEDASNTSSASSNPEASTVYSNNSYQQNNGKATASNAVYSILDNGGHSIQVYHHAQGPLCDAAFKYAQGNDWLVIDYFNITVDNSLQIYETASPVRIQLTIPDDLIMSNRNWRMVCISQGGQPYSFEDEDSNDSTITFTTTRFYAYAMCYNDIQPGMVEETLPVEESAVIPTDIPPVIEQEPSSTIHSANESQTNASTIHSSDTSATLTNPAAATIAPNGTKLKSDQKSAVERADGASVKLVSM